MRFLKKKDGFTLVELLIVILTGSIVTMAATSVLLLAMRINRKSLDTVSRQSIIRIMLSVVENMGSDGDYVYAADAIEDTEGNVVISYNAEEDQIVTGTNSVLVEDVSEFTLSRANTPFDYVRDLYTFSITAQGEQYESTVYSRTQEKDWNADDPYLEYEAGRDTLIKLASSQIGSTGKIMNNGLERVGEWYTKWYTDTNLGTNVFNPGGTDEEEWNPETPWCASFVSWVLDKCNSAVEDEDGNLIQYLITAPQEANVNFLWLEHIYQTYQTDLAESRVQEIYEMSSVPKPGDLVFFVDKSETETLTNLKTLTSKKVALVQSAISKEKEDWKTYNGNDVPYDLWEINKDPQYEDYNVLKHYLNCVGDGLDHVGLVVKATDEYIYTVEGNVSLTNNVESVNHQVVLRKYPLDNSQNKEDMEIFGYATLNWNPAYK